MKNLWSKRYSSGLRNPRHKRRCRPMIEQLEDRLAPAIIGWDGEAGDNDWHNMENWFKQTTGENTNDFLPGASDDAVIGPVFGGQTISVGADAAVQSVASAASLEITGGTFTLGAAASTIDATLAVNGGALVLNQSTLGGSGALSVASEGTVQLRGAKVNTPLTNAGTVHVRDEGNELNGAVTTTEGSLLRLESLSRRSPDGFYNGVLTVAGGFTNNGTIELARIGNRNDFGLHSNLTVTNGTLTNVGTIRSQAALPDTSGSHVLNAELVNNGTLAVEHNLTLNKTDAEHENSSLVVMNADLTISNHAEFSNTGALGIADGTTLRVNGGEFHHNGGSLNAQGFVVLNGATIHFIPDITLAELTLDGATINGPGVLTNPEGSTLRLDNGSSINAALVNEGTILVRSEDNELNGALTTTEGSVLRVQSNSSRSPDVFFYGSLTVANGFTNHGAIELTRTGNRNGFDYHSSLTVANGTLTNAGTITSQASQPDTAAGHILNAELVNEGVLDVNQKLLMDVDGAQHHNFNTFNINDVLTIRDASVSNWGGIHIANGKSLILDNANYAAIPFSVLDGGDLVLNNSILHGVGVITANVLSTSGDVHISSSQVFEENGIMQLDISGDYVQIDSGSSLTVELAEAEPGRVTELNVLGDVELKGPLHLEFYNDFETGDTFEIMSWTGDRTGAGFSEITTEFLGDDQYVEVEIDDVEKTVTVQIFGDPGISIDDATLAEGADGSQDAVFTVTLNNDVTDGFTVDFSTADGTASSALHEGDYQSASGTLTFAGNAGETQTIIVPVNGDEKVELDEGFTVNLSNVSIPDVTILDGVGDGTITNDDSATVSISDVTRNEGDGGVTSYTFTATLDNDVDTSVTVEYETEDGSATVADNDYSPSSGTAHFMGSAGDTASIAVLVNGDTAPEPDENFFVNLLSIAADGRTVTISDNQGEATVVNDDESPFQLQPDSYETNEDTLLVVDGSEGKPSLLANDTGENLSVVSVTQPQHGTVDFDPEINGDGTFTYTPVADFFGEDSFTYTVSDGTETATETVSIEVLPVNDEPAASDDNASVEQNNPVTIHVLDNDNDIDGDALTVSIDTGPANGTVDVNEDGSITYTPASDFIGTDSFIYEVDDNNDGTDTAMVTIEVVSGVPQAAAISFDAEEDGRPVIVPFQGLATNDDDPSAFTYQIVTQPSEGSVTVRPNGTFRYDVGADFQDLAAGEIREVSFTYTAADLDGVVSEPGTITARVSGVNDAPMVHDDGAFLTPITEKDTDNYGDQVYDILGDSVTDMDNNALRGLALINTESDAGSWQYSLDDGLIWEDVTVGNSQYAMLLGGNDWLRFVPDGDGRGTGSIDYRAWDQTSGEAGNLFYIDEPGGSTAFSSSVATAGIEATEVNDAPVLNTGEDYQFDPVAPNDFNNMGTSVTDLLATVGDAITDPDREAKSGIAVTYVDNFLGNWQYSTDDSATWNDFGNPSNGASRLLTREATNRIRFITESAETLDSSHIRFRAWDQSGGRSNGDVANTLDNGGMSPFSARIGTATIAVDPNAGITETKPLNIGDQIMVETEDSRTLSLGDTGSTTVQIAGSKAYFLDQELNLEIHANGDYFNWGGKQEKWLMGNVNQFGNAWYFILPNGEFYAWDASPREPSGALLEIVEPLYHHSPELLADAGPEHLAYILDQGLNLELGPNGDDSWDLFDSQERWVMGITNQFGNNWYYILPSGEFYAYDGTPNQATGRLLATFDIEYHAELGRLHDAAEGDQVSATIDGGNLTLDPVEGFIGHMWVTLTRNDNGEITIVTFKLNVIPANSAPVFAEIEDQKITAGDSLTIPVGVEDADGDDITLTAEAFGLFIDGNDWQNWGGRDEKWLRGTDGRWYFILQNGEFYRWDGTAQTATGQRLATFDPIDWDDLGRLTGTEEQRFSAGIVGADLVIDSELGFAGSFWVLIHADDERDSSYAMIRVTATE